MKTYDFLLTITAYFVLFTARNQYQVVQVLPVGADLGADLAAHPHHWPVDAAEGEAHSQPAVAAPPRLHRHRGRHRRVLRRLQRNPGQLSMRRIRTNANYLI